MYGTLSVHCNLHDHVLLMSKQGNSIALKNVCDTKQKHTH